jgi:hypothetical protein
MTFDDPVSQLIVQTVPPGGSPATKVVSQVDANHWYVEFHREPTDTALSVSANNWSHSEPVRWDAFYGAKIVGNPTPIEARITKLGAKGRIVRFRVAAKGADNAKYRAYIAAGGRRASSVVHGTVASGSTPLKLKLRSANWREARRRGSVVVRVSAGSERSIVRRRLP